MLQIKLTNELNTINKKIIANKQVSCPIKVCRRAGTHAEAQSACRIATDLANLEHTTEVGKL